MSDDRTAANAAPAPLAADVGVVAALGVEVGFLLDGLSRVRKYSAPDYTITEGEVGGKVVAVVLSGVGRQAARRAAEFLIAGHRPRYVLNPGFAGALDPALRRNDVVLPTEIVDPEGGRFTLDVSVTELSGPRVVPGRLATVDALLRTAAEKAAFRERTGADMADMESSAVAAVCAARSLKYLGMRVVSDDAATDLPREVADLMTKTGGYLVGSALRSIWNRPSSLKDFWALHQAANEAADRLARVALATIAALA